MNQITALIYDSFLTAPIYTRHIILDQGFKDLQSPVDGVTYPNICHPLPLGVGVEISFRLTQLIGPIKINHIAARLSPKGVKAPHQAHTDINMGQYTGLIYLNLDKDTPKTAGVSLLSHVSGLYKTPTTPEGIKLWEQDCNDPSKWEVNLKIPSKFNRLVVLNSDLFHRAEPTEGFGETNLTARLAILIFFDRL